MVIEKTVKNALADLMHSEKTTISVGESDIEMKVLEGATKIFFSTPVYKGEDYIPPSVRECVSGECPISEELLKAHLKIDENSFQVLLQFVAGAESLNHSVFQELVEEFAHTADVWRDYLDEHDQRDRVWVRK